MRARRRLLSWSYNTAVRALLGTRVRDVDCALKVFRREALADLLPESSGFFVNTEMLALARQHGHRVAEVGVRHRPRLRGASTVSAPRDVPRMLRRCCRSGGRACCSPRLAASVPRAACANARG